MIIPIYSYSEQVAISQHLYKLYKGEITPRNMDPKHMIVNIHSPLVKPEYIGTKGKNIAVAIKPTNTSNSPNSGKI